MKLNICMLLPLRYGPNMRINPQIGICSYLANFGHEITWVISSENSRTTQKILLNSVHVYAAPYIHYLNESALIGKIFNRFPSTFKKISLILKIFRERKQQYNIIFVRDGTFDGLVACYLKKRYKIPLVYELSSPLEEEWEGAYKVEAMKPLFLWNLMAKVNVLLRIYIMKKADLILPTTKWFEKGLAQKGISKIKLFPFPNGVDLESFSNKDGRSIREKYHLGSSKVITYIGTMGKARVLNVLIRAFSRVREIRGDVKLLMVGDGTGRENLQTHAAELGVKDDVIFTSQVPPLEVPHFIAAADIGVDPRPPTTYYKVSSPIKIFEYMMMAKPVVASEEILENKEVIAQSRGGIRVPFNDEAFASAIITLLNNPEMAKEMGRKGHEWVVKNRSYEILARNVEKRYIQLIEDRA